MKKIYSFLSLALLSFYGFAQSSTSIVNADNVKYYILSKTDKTARVTPNDSGTPTGEITILENVEIGGEIYTVDGISNSSFENNSLITKVNLPNTIVYIGNKSFRNCSLLEEINFPEGLKYLKGSSFQGCSKLDNVTIPSTVTQIEDQTFTNCSGLTQVSLPNTITSIGRSSFAECSNLSVVDIPNSVSFIHPYAFFNCSVISEFNLPESLTTLGDYAFGGCTSLTKFTFNKSAPMSIAASTYFLNVDLSEVELIVPTGASENYNSDNGWVGFKTVSEDSTLSVDVTKIMGLNIFYENGKLEANQDGVFLEIFDISGKRIQNHSLNKGVFIVIAKNLEGQIHIEKLAI